MGVGEYVCKAEDFEGEYEVRVESKAHLSASAGCTRRECEQMRGPATWLQGCSPVSNRV